MRKYAAITLCTSAILEAAILKNAKNLKREKGSRSSYTKRRSTRTR